MRRVIIGLVAVLFVAWLPIATNAAPPKPPVGEGVPAFGHVFVIIGENAELGNVNKSNSPVPDHHPRAAVGLAHELLRARAQLARQLRRDDLRASSSCATRTTIRPTRATRTSRTCSTSSMSPGSAGRAGWSRCRRRATSTKESGTLQDSNTYRVKHNPAVYYDNVEGAGGVWSATNKSAECLANVIPAGGDRPERHERLRLGAPDRQRAAVQPRRPEPMRGRARQLQPADRAPR